MLKESDIATETTTPILSLLLLSSSSSFLSSTTDTAGRPWSLPQSSLHVAIVVNGEAAMIALTATAAASCEFQLPNIAYKNFSTDSQRRVSAFSRVSDFYRRSGRWAGDHHVVVVASAAMSSAIVPRASHIS